MAWSSDNTLETTQGVSGAVTGAATGATIGSVVPGVGTAIGAGVGALVGGLSSFFSSNIARRKQEEAEATAKKQIMEKRRKNLLDRYMARKQEMSIAQRTPQSGSRRGMDMKNPTAIVRKSPATAMAMADKQMNSPPSGSISIS